MVDKTNELAEVFKAVSDPTRLRLVKMMAEHQGQLCVNALAHRLRVSQSAVSQHLRVLRQAGLVRPERCGCHVHYALDQRRVRQCLKLFADTLGKFFEE